MLELIVGLLKTEGNKQKKAALDEPAFLGDKVEAAPGFEPGVTVLQTVALALGYAALI